MQVLSGMIKQLDSHKKDLTSDAAQLMEVCENLEFENRRMSQESSVRISAVISSILSLLKFITHSFPKRSVDEKWRT